MSRPFGLALAVRGKARLLRQAGAMTPWVLLALPLAVFVLPLFVLGRGGRARPFPGGPLPSGPLPGGPLSALQTAQGKRQSKRTKAALEAATLLLQ